MILLPARYVEEGKALPEIGLGIQKFSDLVAVLFRMIDKAREDRSYWNLYELIRDEHFTEKQLLDNVNKYKKRYSLVANLYDKMVDILKSNSLMLGVTTKNAQFVQYVLESMYSMKRDGRKKNKDTHRLVIKTPSNAHVSGLLSRTPPILKGQFSEQEEDGDFEDYEKSIVNE